MRAYSAHPVVFDINDTPTNHLNVLQLGVQSTQRAESIHSAIKKHTSASGLLVQLGQTLITYANGAELKHETKRARDILVAAARSFSNQSGHMPAVQHMDGRISGFAMDIVRAQQAQAMAYMVAEGVVLGNGVKTYILQRSVTCPNLPLNANERIQEDYALPSSTAMARRVRHTTLYGCTCQFPSCWGLPCRHMLRLYLHLQHTEVPQGVVRDRWMTRDAAYIAEQKRKLLRTTPLLTLTGRENTQPQQMSRSERFTYLMFECKSLGEVASATEDAMDILVKHLDLARAKIAELQLPDELDNHGFSPDLFPNGVLNPGLPTTKGRPQTKRIESSGRAHKPKEKKSKA